METYEQLKESRDQLRAEVERQSRVSAEVVGEASRQVAASDNLFRETCAEVERLRDGWKTATGEARAHFSQSCENLARAERAEAELVAERKTSAEHCAKRIDNLIGLLNYKDQVTILRQALDDIATYHSVKDSDLCPYGCDAPMIARNALDKTRPIA